MQKETKIEMGMEKSGNASSREIENTYDLKTEYKFAKNMCSKFGDKAHNEARENLILLYNQGKLTIPGIDRIMIKARNMMH